MGFRRHSRFVLFLAGFMACICFMAMPSRAAQLDDSTLFIEAFNAYRIKDYLLTIDKLNQLSEIFPDSPLRDVSLLLLARAGLYSGDNELAAKAASRFTAEFGDTPLTASLEDELLALGARRNKGEKLLPDKQLRAAALKVRQEQLALAEQARLAREQAERERLAAEKAEQERKERERLAAEKLAKERIKLTITLPPGNRLFNVGQDGQVPFTLVNTSDIPQGFMLAAVAPPEYAATLVSVSRPGETLDRVTLAASEKIEGVLAFRVPSDRVDGYKATLQLKAESATYSDVLFAKDTHVTALAPLVRAVAKPERSAVVKGEAFSYHIALLNAGSLAARELTMRVAIPPQLTFNDTGKVEYDRDGEGAAIFRVAALETGSMMEFNVNVHVMDNAQERQELRLQLEVIDGQLQQKETFVSKAAIVTGR